jgi:hypothetical protein
MVRRVDPEANEEKYGQNEKAKQRATRQPWLAAIGHGAGNDGYKCRQQERE